MRRLIILVLICLFGSVQILANPVTVSQAKEKANQFLNKRAAKRAPGATSTTKTLKMMEAGKDDSYFIFNVEEEGGYVVVSGDDATEEILGYSDTGRIDPDNMPCGMRMLLDNYASQIQFLRENGITRDQNQSTRKASARSYHIPSTLAIYDQWEPYNSLCPESSGNNSHDRCPTGCVATAMAQLMYHYRWPHSITSTIPSFTTKTNGYSIEAIPSGTDIDWINILPEYIEGEYNNDHKNAIVNLMKMAGCSVHMDYKANSSDAFTINVPYALKKYFGYETSVFEYASSYSWEEWLNMLRENIDNNHPVLYSGSTISYDVENQKEKTVGHAFLLEGYDEDGYFDINFGWGGTYNDKFLLDCILQDNIIKFSSNQGAVLNVKPQSTLAPMEIPLILSTTGFQPTETFLFLRSQSSNQFENVKLWAKLRNYSPIDTYFNYGFRFVPADNINQVTKDIIFDESIRMQSMGKNGQNGDFTEVDSGYQDGVEYSFTFGNEIPDGIYIINCISKESGTSVWYDNDFNLTTVAIICNGICAFPYLGEDKTLLNIYYFLQTSETPLRVGQPSEFTYIIENTINNYVDIYDGAIFAIAEWKEGDVEKNKPIFIDEMQVQPNGLSAVKGFTFTPLVAGEQDIVFYNKSLEEIGRYTVNVISANESLDMLEVTDFKLIDGDMERRLIDGTYLRANMSMKNHDAVTKKADITIGLNNVEAQTKWTKTIAVSIEPNSTVGYNFGFGNLTAGNHYIVTASYPNGEVFYTSPELLCTTEGLGEVEPGNESLVQYEYWFDDDFVNCQTVGMGSNSAVIRASINTNNLTFGPHRFNFRVKRSDNKYSAVTSSVFFKKPAGRASRIEYWLDDDRGNVFTISGSLASDGLDYIINDSINLGAVTPGHHRLYCRAVSDDGRIASAVTMTPIIVKSKYAGITPADVKITNYSIAIDNEEPITFTLPSPGQDVVVEKKYNARDLTTGNHQLTLRFNNSIGAGVSENSTFSVKSQETPVINLTAQESDGLVNIKFNSIPNDISYRIYRVDANGALAYLNQMKGSYYPNEISFTDNPPKGSYRYYAKGKYESVNGEQPIVTSNEAGVTMSADVAEVIEYGYISGVVQTDVPGFFGKSRNVVFSDGETVKCDNSGRFYRDKIPVGNNLTVTLEADAEYTATTKDITVKAGSNTVHISVERKSGNDYQLVDSDSPLQFTSTFAEVVPGQYYRFEVKNVSGRSWKGRVSVKVLRKDYVDDSKAPYTALKNYNYAYSEEFSIGAGKTREVYLPEIAFSWNALQKDYYFYFECNDGKDTKLIELDPENNIASNPLQRLVEEDAMVSAANEVLEENVTFAVNLIMRMLSGVKEIDGKLGDFNDYLKVSKECLGYDIEYLDFDYLSRKIDHVASYDQLFWDNELWRFKTIVYSEADHFEKGINKFREKTATLVRESKDILKVIKDVQQVLEYAKAYNEWQGMEDTERMIYFSERILDYAASHGDPFVKILKTYLDVTRITIANAKLLGGAYHRGFDAVYFSSENLLPESERVGSFKHNRYLDFRIRVKKEDSWWRLVDSYFDAEAVKKQIFDVTVTARNKMGGHGDFRAEATFTPVVDGDYIYLRQTGISGALSLGDGIEDMWMNIRWKNGRTTRVPLRHGSEVEGDGVKYNGLSLPFRYTITFQSGSSDEGNMADIIKIDD